MVIAILYMGVGSLAAVGYGAMLARLLKIRPNAGELGLLGLMCMGSLAAVVHFLLPVGQVVQYTLLSLGVVALFLSRPQLGGLASLGFSILAFGSVFFHPSPTPFHDNGLYHLQTLFWNTQTALTPGLVNLHGRFGFNSLLFLIVPVVATPVLGWIANSIVAAFALLACMGRLRDHCDRKASAAGFWFLVGTVVAVTLAPHLMGWISILDADGAMAALIVYWTFLLFEYEQGMRPETTTSLLLLFAVFAVVIKLGAVPALAVTLILLITLREQGSAQKGAPGWQLNSLPVRRVWLVAAAVLAIWSARGMVLSGCLAYPVPQTCVYSLPWAVAQARVVGESDGIRSWARTPGTIDYQSVLSDWRWFGRWFDERWNSPLFEALRWSLLAAVGALGLAFVARREIDRPALRVAVILCGGIAFWFWAAPDPRFGIGYLSGIGILGAAVAAGVLIPWQAARTVATVILLAGLAVWSVHAAVGPLWRTLPVLPPADAKPVLFTVDGSWGIPIRVTGAADDRCWDAPIPCTPLSAFSPASLSKVYWRTLPVHRAAESLPKVPARLPIPVRINVGGSAYTDSLGHAWAADVGAQQGWPATTATPVTGTADPELYRSARFSESDRLEYEFKIPNGRYTVVLKFAEIWETAAHQRVVDVVLNGVVAQSQLDVFAAAQGANRPFDLRLPLDVREGWLDIAVMRVSGKPCLNALEILSEDTASSEKWAVAEQVVPATVKTSSPAPDTVQPDSELMNYDLGGLLSHSTHMVYGKPPVPSAQLPAGVFQATSRRDHLAAGFVRVQIQGSPRVTAVEVYVKDPSLPVEFGAINMVLQDQDYSSLYVSGSLPKDEDRSLVSLPAGVRSVRLAFLSNDQGYVRLPQFVRLRAFTEKSSGKR